MKTPQFVSQIVEDEVGRSTVEALASHPRVAIGTVAANGAIVGAVNTEIITGYISLYSTIIGAITLTVVCGVWIVKFIRDWNSLQRETKE